MAAISRRHVLAASAGLVACPAFIRKLGAAPPPIRIGMLVSLTGSSGAEEQDQLRGAEIAVAEFNAQGGLDGRMAELVIRDDDRHSPDAAAARARELIQKENVAALTGALDTRAQTAVDAVVREHKILFNATGPGDAIAEPPAYSPFTFHEAPSLYMSIGAVARYAFARFGKKAMLLASSDAFGQGATRIAKKIAKEAGAEVVSEITTPAGTADFSAYLPHLETARADVLLLLNTGRDQMLAARQATDLGLKNRLHIVAPALSFFGRIVGGPETYDGVMGVSPYYWSLEEAIPSAQAFNNKFRKANLNIEPSDHAAVAYSAARSILEAAHAAGSVEPAKLADALRSTRYDHYKGPQSYRECDRQSVQRIFLLTSLGMGETRHDVFNIIGGEGPDSKLLGDCARDSSVPD
jgi:branched-chain amino acid transport system substrate-binding protein